MGLIGKFPLTSGSPPVRMVRTPLRTPGIRYSVAFAGVLPSQPHPQKTKVPGKTTGDVLIKVFLTIKPYPMKRQMYEAIG